MSEVILVNERGEKTGTADILEAHTGRGMLHKAFSAYVFRNSRKELLLQRRSSKKMLWPLAWANTCCSHPRDGESLREAGERRLKEEMGFICTLAEGPSFVYRAEDPNKKGAEHEHVTTLIGDVESVEVNPDPDEVTEYAWMDVEKLLGEMEKNPDAYAPWLPLGLTNILTRPMIHVAIIPDGNRRWAEARGLPTWKGHERSAENFETMLGWGRKSGRISTLTFWAFSIANWNRGPEEVKRLMGILEEHLEKKRLKFLKSGVRFVHSGRRDRLSPRLRTLIEDIERETASMKEFTLNLALDYGGKEELLHAVRELKGKEITEESIRAHVYHPELPDIDLVIRTSGERRASDFALWTAAYAEWVFIEHYFPDLSEADLTMALEEYDKRRRRFGR